MKLRVWDAPLNQDKFSAALRALDQSISESQIKSLFVSIRNTDGEVPVPDLIRNFTGRAYETVDFRNRVYK